MIPIPSCQTELLCVQSCRNPDLDDRIFECLLTSIAAVQTEDMRATFLFASEVNGYHQEWLSSAATNRHGVAPFDFATVSACPTHARGGTLDLLMAVVSDVVRVAVVAPKGNSDHSSMAEVISMALAIPNLCVSNKVFLKHQVNWKTVSGAIQDLPWRDIWFVDNLVEVPSSVWMELCPCWLDVMHQLRSSVCATRINQGQMINAGMLFGLKQEAHLRWTCDRFLVNWEEFVRCQVRANETN